MVNSVSEQTILGHFVTSISSQCFSGQMLHILCAIYSLTLREGGGGCGTVRPFVSFGVTCSIFAAAEDSYTTR